MTTYTAAELATRDERREKICGLMVSGEWRGSTSRRSLAAEWGLKVAEVYRIEGEAAGSVRQLRKTSWADEVHAICEAKYAELDELIALARRNQKQYVVAGDLVAVDAPEVGAMLKAISMQLEIMGVTRRPGDRTQPGGADDYDKLSHQERAKMLREAAEEEMRMAERDGSRLQ